MTDTLVDRIESALRANPDVVVGDCWDLFDLPGFDCKDLEPTYAQAAYALEDARQRIKERP